MQKAIASCVVGCALLILPESGWAQGFGEYGRAVGSIPRGPVSNPGGPGGSSSGRVDGPGVGELRVRGLPTRLIVASKEAGLFPRQDDELERIAQLVEGEKLVPLVQSEGSSHWYIVKTERGAIGWVKSSDVKQEAPSKK